MRWLLRLFKMGGGRKMEEVKLSVSMRFANDPDVFEYSRTLASDRKLFAEGGAILRISFTELCILLAPWSER